MHQEHKNTVTQNKLYCLILSTDGLNSVQADRPKWAVKNLAGSTFPQYFAAQLFIR